MMMVEHWSQPDDIVACDVCNIGCDGGQRKIFSL